MKTIRDAFCATVFCVLLAAVAQAQPAQTEETTQTPPTDAAGPVAVTVNGHPILQNEVDRVFRNVIQQQMPGQQVPPELSAQLRERLAPQILDALIEERLLDEAAEKASIKLEQNDYVSALELKLRAHLIRTGIARDEFARNVQRDTGQSLDDFLARRAADPEFKKTVRHARLLEKQHPEDVKVTDEEVRSRYEQEKEGVYTRPAKVRASHILIGTDESGEDAGREAARQKADLILAEAKKPDADFAELARNNSACPSHAQGGDLGFFANDGTMVEPFARAAFALKPGEISDVVETPFGFHIIKVTDRKDSTVLSLDRVKDVIRDQIQSEKLAQVREQHVAELRDAATIEYPE